MTDRALLTRAGPPRRLQHRRRGRRWLRRSLGGLLALLLLLVAAVAVLWPLTPSVADAPARVRADLAAHGARPLDALPSPDRVGAAVIATEDSRFERNPGIDALGVLRAARSTITGHDSGGATLEQQLAKRLYTPDRGDIAAQLEDAELALKLNAHYSKSTLLRMYLSDAYFGHGYWGLHEAANGYFGRSAADLTWAQASLLAGLVQAPSAYDPIEHLHLAKLRQRHVLDRLVATGVLSRAAADTAARAPLGLTSHTNG